MAERREVASALAAIGAHRFFYGISTISMLLLYRNYFTDDGVFQAGLAGLGPGLRRHRGRHAHRGGHHPGRGPPDRQAGLGDRAVRAGRADRARVRPAVHRCQTILPAALLLGIVAQGSKICVDTLVQEQVEDDFRGRVFSFYDTLFNVTFVAAAVVAAFLLPTSGQVVRDARRRRQRVRADRGRLRPGRSAVAARRA